jgi:hypothetical protein
MSFRSNQEQQLSLNDRMNNLTEREQRILNKSWAKPFGDYIFPMINEERFSVLYSDNGRPNTPVNIVIGAMILKELTKLTDEEMFESIILDPRYQYALRLTSFEEIPFSDRTMSRFRERLYYYEMDTGEDLLKDEIERLAEEFAKQMKISGTLKRMDSLMVSSSCKRMGRLELIYTCVSNLVKALVKSGESGILPDHFMKYADASNKNAYCYRLTSDEVLLRLEELTADAILLFELTGELCTVYDEYQLLERLLSDQTHNGVLKPNKEINPNSLQNPSDEDATFRRKGNKTYQGFVANVVEDCGDNGRIITQYDYRANQHPDTEFCADVIKSLGEQDEPIIIVADGAFASTENTEAAAKNNIELVATALTGVEPNRIINAFIIENNRVISCPAGHAPIYFEYREEKKMYRMHFNKQACESCPYLTSCPVKLQKKRALVELTKQSIERAALAKKLKTDEYKAYARLRNGVEGIPSVLRRRYGVDEMPVRGLVRSKMWFGFKIGAINAKRFIAYVFESEKGCSIDGSLADFDFSLTKLTKWKRYFGILLKLFLNRKPMLGVDCA